MTNTLGAIPLDAVQRVLIVNLRHIGDVLLSGAVPQALRQLVPHCEIDALVYSDAAAMLTYHPALAEVHVIDRAWKDAGFLARARAELQLLRRLQRRHYDLLIVLTPHRRAQWLARLLRPRWAVATPYPAAGAGWKRRFPWLVHRPIATWRHIVEIYLDSLRVLGCHPSPQMRTLPLVAGEAAERRADEVLATHGLADGGFVVIHPGSRWSFKCLPPATVASLIDALAERGERVVLTGAPNADEQAMVQAVLALAKSSACDLSGGLSLKELAAVIARAKLFIGVDSAPMHMAAALDVPQVAVFGPSGAREWGPWSRKSRVLTNTDYQCVPCGRAGCANSKRSECLAELPPMRLIEAVDQQLSAIANQHFVAPDWCAHLVASPESKP